VCNGFGGNANIDESPSQRCNPILPQNQFSSHDNRVDVPELRRTLPGIGLSLNSGRHCGFRNAPSRIDRQWQTGNDKVARFQESTLFNGDSEHQLNGDYEHQHDHANRHQFCILANPPKLFLPANAISFD
jgi:hypothetical protein